jgi:hypothetical protein
MMHLKKVIAATFLPLLLSGCSITNNQPGKFKVLINIILKINKNIDPLCLIINSDGTLSNDHGLEFTDEDIKKLFEKNKRNEFKLLLCVRDYKENSIYSVKTALEKLSKFSDKKKDTIVSVILPEILKEIQTEVP